MFSQYKGEAVNDVTEPELSEPRKPRNPELDALIQATEEELVCQ